MSPNPLRDARGDVRVDLDPAETLKPGDEDWNDPCAFCEGWPTVHPTGICRACSERLAPTRRRR